MDGPTPHGDPLESRDDPFREPRPGDPAAGGRPPDGPAPGHPGGPAGGPAAPEGPLPPLPVRVGQTLFSPTELFRALAARPVAAGALVLGAVLLALSNLALPVEVFEEAARTQALELDQDLPVDPATMGRIMKVGSIFGSAIVWPIIALVSAGIYALVLMFGFGFQGTYRQYLSVTAHAMLIPALGALLLIPLRMMASDPQLSLSLASIVFFLEEGYVYRFLSYLDLFGLWSYVLVGLGAAVVDGTRPARTAIGVTVGLAVLLSALIAMFTG